MQPSTVHLHRSRGLNKVILVFSRILIPKGGACYIWCRCRSRCTCNMSVRFLPFASKNTKHNKSAVEMQTHRRHLCSLKTNAPRGMARSNLQHTRTCCLMSKRQYTRHVHSGYSFCLHCCISLSKPLFLSERLLVTFNCPDVSNYHSSSYLVIKGLTRASWCNPTWTSNAGDIRSHYRNLHSPNLPFQQTPLVDPNAIKARRTSKLYREKSHDNGARDI